jgi:hypothetical protein
MPPGISNNKTILKTMPVYAKLYKYLNIPIPTSIAPLGKGEMGGIHFIPKLYNQGIPTKSVMQDSEGRAVIFKIASLS